MSTKGLFKAISFLFLLFIVSCAPRYVETPAFYDLDLNSHLSKLSNIQSVEAILSLGYEKGDSLMNGDASLSVSEDNLNLEVYYLGFLAGSISENNGVITISHKIDRNKSHMLVEGLKKSFLWWRIKDYIVEDDGEFYKLQNYNRKIFLEKKTLLPVKQFIELYNGDELKILYASPAKIVKEDEKNPNLSGAAMWYQSAMTIFLNKNVLKIKINSYNIKMQ